ncbi:MAG: hypothetical protein ACRCY4_01190, partial [Brevinema sp.]
TSTTGLIDYLKNAGTFVRNKADGSGIERSVWFGGETDQNIVIQTLVQSTTTTATYTYIKSVGTPGQNSYRALYRRPFGVAEYSTYILLDTPYNPGYYEVRIQNYGTLTDALNNFDNPTGVTSIYRHISTRR